MLRNSAQAAALRESLHSVHKPESRGDATTSSSTSSSCTTPSTVSRPLSAAASDAAGDDDDERHHDGDRVTWQRYSFRATGVVPIPSFNMQAQQLLIAQQNHHRAHAHDDVEGGAGAGAGADQTSDALIMMTPTSPQSQSKAVTESAIVMTSDAAKTTADVHRDDKAKVLSASASAPTAASAAAAAASCTVDCAVSLKLQVSALIGKMLTILFLIHCDGDMHTHYL